MKHPYCLTALLLMVGFVDSSASVKPIVPEVPSAGNVKTLQMPDGKSHFRISSDDERDSRARHEMRLARRKASKVLSEVATPEPRRAEALTYTVTCVFEGEDMPYFAIYTPGFFEETSYDIYFEQDETDRYYFQVPAGSYDVATQVWCEKDGRHGWANLVHEDVEVSGDMTISFTIDEATEYFSLRPMLRNGEPMELPTVTYLEEEPWIEIDESKANAGFFYGDYALFKEGCELFVNGMIMADCHEADDNNNISFFCSKLSDKYHLVAYTFIRTMDGDYEIGTSDITGIYDRVADTYIKDFVKYPVPEFADTPIYLEEGCERNRIALTGYYWLNDVQIGGGGAYCTNPTPNVYVTSQPTTGFDVKTVVRPVSLQMEKLMTFEEEYDGEIYTWTETVRLEMPALPAWHNGSEWEYINQNHSECGNFSYQRPLEGPIVEYPGVEPYCFTADGITQPFGNSSPVLVLMTQIPDWDGVQLISLSPQAWVGRYGEVRNCDSWTATTKVEGDGEKVLFDSLQDGYLEEWVMDYFTTPHDPSALKATFKDTNILIDGEIPGFNLTTVEIDESREDRCTPTPQMLIFKNTSGVITDRFNAAKDGVIEFSAGDFNWHESEDSWGYSVEEADVTVEYAPYGEEAWQKIEVEEVPEYFYMPGFGYFYRGSLECVDVPSSNGWYDLRLTLTDKAGNRTVEHISPAFKVGTGSGVKGLAVDGVKVWAADGAIRTNATDVTAIAAYALDGTLIASGNGSTLFVGGYAGALLVRLTTPAGTTTHKLLLR